MDPRATNYEVEVRIQDMGLVSTQEVIQDMKIVMYRDGCSEGQFLMVLAKELVAMREACTEIQADYKPAITFVVVQKRHHTRFFPTDNNKYKNGNVLAGTVVDQ